jgi:tetratricopeptide (TPR) repeat protein
VAGARTAAVRHEGCAASRIVTHALDNGAELLHLSSDRIAARGLLLDSPSHPEGIVAHSSAFARGTELLAPRATQPSYRVRDVRAMYPAVSDVYLRYLEKWGLIHASGAGADRTFSFADLLVIRQANAELERGGSFRGVLRSLVAAHEGQLALDFRPPRPEAQPARVIALERPATPARPVALQPGQAAAESLAARCFLEGAALDDGDPARQEAAAAAYRRALSLDPGLVPALINLANIHYARDEAIEAQVLYERALATDASCFEAHFNLGNVHHDLGRYPEAQACYRDALALNPAYADAHFYLAVTLEKLGRSADARPHWRAYQHLAPEGEWVELAREFSEDR